LGRADFIQDAERWAQAVAYARSVVLNDRGKGLCVVAEADPIRYMALALCAMEAGVSIVLANPYWGEHEWGAFFERHQVSRLWGNERTYVAQDKPYPNGLIAIPTGGSTGGIKLCMHTVDTLEASVRGVQRFFDLDTMDSVCVLPLYHVSGWMQVMRAVMNEGRLWLGSFKEWVEAGLSVPEGWQMSLVPTMLTRSIEDDALVDRLRSARCLYVGGASVSEKRLQDWAIRGLPVVPCYGMTETASMIAATRVEDVARYGLEAEVLPHASVSVGESMELLVRSESMFLGYLHECVSISDETGGVWVSGDVGAFEGERLRVLGRRDSIINTGGEKVLPSEIEALLLECSGVHDVHVFGVLDDEWGEVVICIYAGGADSDELEAFLKTRVIHYKVPKKWIRMDALPRDERGKLDRAFVKAYARELR